MYTFILTIVLGGIVGFLCCSKKQSLRGKIANSIIGAAVSGILIGGCITSACAKYAEPVLEEEFELVRVLDDFYLLRIDASDYAYVVIYDHQVEGITRISIWPCMAPEYKSKVHEYSAYTGKLETPRVEVWKTHSKWVDNRTLYKFYVPEGTVFTELTIFQFVTEKK